MIFVLKAWRDLRAMRIRALLLVLVIGAGVGMAGGIGLALRDIQATRSAFYQHQGLPDLDVRLHQSVPSNVLTTRARDAGATAAGTRLIFDGTVTRGARRTAAELVGTPTAGTLDRPAIIDGRGLTGTDPMGAALEAEYARKAGVRIGDLLEVAIGARRFQVSIRGIMRSPEYLLATANPQYLIPDPGSLAVVFLPIGGLSKVMSAGHQANDLIMDFPPGTSEASQEKVAAGLPVSSLTPRSQQYSLRLTDADLRSFRLFVPILTGVFAIVGFLLIGLSLRRMVHSQRRELGTLLAMGYRRRSVLATALFPAAMLAVPGAAVAAAATAGIGRLVAATYVSLVGFPAIVNTLPPGPLSEAAAIAFGATITAAMLPAWSLIRLSPAAAMRGDAAVRFRLPSWLRHLSGAASPAVTYASRSLLRRPLLTTATLLSLSAAIGLGAAMNLLISSTSHAVEETFGSQRWTAAADLAQPMPIGSAIALARHSGASAVEAVVEGPARLEAPTGTSADVQLVGLPPSPHLETLKFTAGGAPRPGQVVVSEQTATALNIKAGDHLHVLTPSGSRDMTVSGTSRTLASAQTYLPYPDAASLLGLPGQANSMFLTAPDVAAERLLDQPQTARVTTLAGARSAMQDTVRELTGLIDVLLAISLSIGALFLVSSLALSFLDRQGEFATLRALGYGQNRVAVILGTEALGQSVMAGLLSVPVGLLIAWPLASRISQAWFHIGLHPAPSDFGLMVALAIALAALVALDATRWVMRLDIARVVRARLIG